MSDSEEKFLEEYEEQNENGAQAELAKSNTLASRLKTNSKKMEMELDGEPEGQLTIDVYQTTSEIVIESAVAGVDADDLDIDVTTDSVSIVGRRKRDKQIKDGDYIYQECYWGKFSRSVILPQEIDPDKASVDFKNGILSIHLPKLSRKKSKKLKVKTD